MISDLCGGVSTSRRDESSEESFELLIEGPGWGDCGSVFVVDSFFNLTFSNPAFSSSSNCFSSSFSRFFMFSLRFLKFIFSNIQNRMP